MKYNEDLLNQLKEDLVQYPAKIAAAERKVFTLSNKLNEAKYLMEKWEINELAKISNETDGDKKLYSNENLRKSELERRKDVNINYKALVDDVDKLRFEKEEAEIDLRLFQNGYKSTLKLADIWIGE